MENFVTDTVKSCILKIINTPAARVHFVGILGAGMLPLARLLRHLGLFVSGTDRRDMTDGERGITSGIAFTPYHTANGMRGVDLVVYSLAVPPDSAELVYARGRGIPTVTRADLLGAVASTYTTSVAVAGTHGKSTTTAILTHILSLAGMSPTVVSGAALTTGDALMLGGSDLFVMEACEYKNAFHSIRPTLAVVTNIDHDHVDCFPDIGAVAGAFHRFLFSAGTVMLNGGCPVSMGLAHGLDGVLTYGTPDADYPLLAYTLDADDCKFTMLIDGEKCHFTLPVAGWGNLMDSVAAISVAHRLGLPVHKIRTAVASFTGIARRMQPLGTIGGRAVYYDYAHHPREIENTLTVLRHRHGGVGVIFRPHTYSRTAAFLDGFRASLSLADAIALIDVYAARESEADGIPSSRLAEYIGDGAALVDWADALDYVLTHSRGAIVLMGAGEVDGILDEIRRRLDAPNT